MSNSTEIVLGNIEKDSKYRKRIEDNTEEKTHPRNQGIIMQAHHLISGDAVKRSSIGNLMKQYGYDINNINNLVLLPYTLEGACHLEVQLHRGNHASPAADELLDPDDRPHPPSYHHSVMRLLDRLDRNFTEKCEGADSKVDDNFRLDVDKISKVILKKIGGFDSNFQLTSVYNEFKEKNNGCSGFTNVPQLKASKNSAPCPCKRDHKGKKHMGLGASIEIKLTKSKYLICVGK